MSLLKQLNEANRQKTKTAIATDISDIFKDDLFGAPTTQNNKSVSKASRAPDLSNVNVDTNTLPTINQSNLPTDEISDEVAAHRANNTATPGAIDPEPETPGTIPAVIQTGVVGAGTVEPEWYTVSSLPGYMVSGIRALGRTVFNTYTSTPLEQIEILVNLGNSGPNEMTELNAVAGWARENAELMQRESEAATASFGDMIPGYTPRVKLYRTPVDTFLVVKDEQGHYIYKWPTDDTIGIDNNNNARLESQSFSQFYKL